MSEVDKESGKKQTKPVEPIAPSLGINYASSPLLEYAYPPINETIVQNITNAIIAVPKLYTQVLHLMNKMNLPPPFGPARKRPSFPDVLPEKQSSRVDELKNYGPSKLKRAQLPEEEEEEEDEEEEMEEEGKRGDMEMDGQGVKPTFLDKRPHTSQSADASSNPFSETKTSITFSTPQQSTPSISGVVSVENKGIQNFFVQPAAVRTCISRQEIIKHRISKEEMSQHKAFANYNYGEPSAKLYLRNMPKDITEDDLLQLFGCFFDRDEVAKEYEMTSLQIRVMDGRMKGQAFITFPSVELAREALTTVNGYLLKEKPVVIVSECELHSEGCVICSVSVSRPNRYSK